MEAPRLTSPKDVIRAEKAKKPFVAACILLMTQLC